MKKVRTIKELLSTKEGKSVNGHFRGIENLSLDNPFK